MAPHKLFGFISGAESFDVATWLDLVKKEVIPNAIIVGGTGLYFNALFHGLSPIPNIPSAIRDQVRAMDNDEVAKLLGDKADGNPQRMKRALEVKLATGKEISEWHKITTLHPYSPDDFVVLNLNVSRETIYQNINNRFLKMIESGAVEEVEQILKMDLDANLPVMKAVGVPEISSWLKGEVSREIAIETAQQKSRNYAKRQMTWFRNSMPENKIDIANYDDAIKVIGT